MTIRIDGTNSAANPGITGSDTDTGLQFGTDEVNIVTGGTTRATVDSSGRLGIGNTNPGDYYNSQLVIGNTSNTQTGFTLSSSTSGVSRILFADADSGADRYRAAFQYAHSTDRFDWRSAGDQLRMSIDSSGDLKFNSGYGSVATAFGVRAWVSFNGTGTVSIRSSGNISSITDNGVGDYTLNFTNAMPDINYSAVGHCGYPAQYVGIFHCPKDATPRNTASVRMATYNTATVQADYLYVDVLITR